MEDPDYSLFSEIEEKIEIDVNNNQYDVYVELNTENENIISDGEHSCDMSHSNPDSLHSCISSNNSDETYYSGEVHSYSLHDNYENVIADTSSECIDQQSDSYNICIESHYSLQGVNDEYKNKVYPADIDVMLNPVVLVEKMSDDYVKLVKSKHQHVPLKSVALKKNSQPFYHNRRKISTKSTKNLKISRKNNNKSRKINRTVEEPYQKLDGQKVKCVRCGKTYSCISSHNRHIKLMTCIQSAQKKTSSVIKKVSCTICNRTFESKRGLITHTTTCERKVSEKNSNKQSIQIQRNHHRKRHISNPPISYKEMIKNSGMWFKIVGKNRCRFCGKFFETRHHLMTHKQKEICEKADRLKCPMCENMISNTYFIRHINYHKSTLDKQDQADCPEDTVMTDKKTLIKKVNRLMNL